MHLILPRLTLLRLLVTALVAWAAGARVVAQTGVDDRPNVLFIYTDDQSMRTLGCYLEEGAQPWAQTPHIDRLAKEGVRFSNAYGASWCVPSRAVVLTGQQPHAIQGLDLNRDMSSRRPWATLEAGWNAESTNMWPRELREAGYETAMIGKWHTGQNSGHGDLWDHSVVWDQNTPTGDWYNGQSLSVDGAPAEVVPGYSTFVYTDFAEDYIRRDHDKPWLLWLCYNAPHLPNTVHPDAQGTYRDAEVEIPEDWYGPRVGKPAYMRTLTMYRPDIEGSPRYHYPNRSYSLKEMITNYHELVVSLDEAIGRLYATLEETGQLDDTVIVFTSDQGFAWGQHGYAWKVGPYDACLRMPMLVRYPPEAKAGGVVRSPVSIIDVVPTILSLTGLEVDWDLHGRNLRPALNDPAAGVPGRVLTEHFLSNFGDQIQTAVTDDNNFWRTIPWWLSVTEGRLKYIRTLVPNEVEELYDLAADPGEQRNLALEAAHRTDLLRMREALAEELESTNAQFRSSLPAPQEMVLR
ncbi:sulfatase-like hydrolase/transferase [Synoicihabitans lomoniglobus]|uniref:Sulfatase-like hydrolase/transferase n=1 Tax=Synoicihabitans lomoniglobus TaxID=2909285 RepID=A0AAE9ZU05_9BACT|nr:sulfatase-like hydrolase/transferase [Opitutaceae bacterium LMO-M01]WED64077.1 sulfatase-like hydrolase/transferase [Opitutaceae bacterium LMO-M01]